MLGRPMLLQYGPHFFSTLSSKFGQLAKIFLGKRFTAGKKVPARLWLFGTFNILQILQLYASRFHYAYFNVN